VTNTQRGIPGTKDAINAQTTSQTAQFTPTNSPRNVGIHMKFPFFQPFHVNKDFSQIQNLVGRIGDLPKTKNYETD